MNAAQIVRLVVEPFATNCYIVSMPGSRHCVVIDPGGDANLILESLQERQLTLSIILLTHGHIDHLLALPELTAHDTVEIFAHTDEQPILAEVALQAQMFGLRKVVPPKVNRWLQDGEELEIDGLEFVVLHTPGHSPGSCCFLLAAVVFVGDTLFEAAIGRTDLPGGNFAQLLQSIRSRLLILPDETEVYPGHGETTTIGKERNGNPFLTTGQGF